MYNSSLLKLKRTDNTTMPYYVPDGAGRDSFISANNGGFYSMPHSKLGHLDSWDSSPKPQGAQKYGNLSTLPQMIPYQSDGKGRDSYIKDNLGGTCKKFDNNANLYFQ